MTEVSAAPVVVPLWRRARFWLALAVLVLLAAGFVTSLTRPPGRPLDPNSAAKAGSQALRRLLAARGTEVQRSTTVADVSADASIVVAFPDSYSAEQLRALGSSGRRLILLGPGPAARRAVAPGLEEREADSGAHVVAPGCTIAGAQAAGAVRFPSGTVTRDAAQCYRGRVAVVGRLAIVGSAALARNDTLADEGVAALMINLISEDGQIRRVVWLLPGADARGDGGASVWVLLPDWAPRATVWLLVVGVLLTLWRSRRMGPVVAEPLPIVVRAAEIVEGHGRLYRRAQALDRAAESLRAATLARLTRRLGLPSRSDISDVAAAAERSTGRPAATIVGVLAGRPARDEADLLALAAALDDLEDALSGKGSHP